MTIGKHIVFLTEIIKYNNDIENKISILAIYNIHMQFSLNNLYVTTSPI